MKYNPLPPTCWLPACDGKIPELLRWLKSWEGMLQSHMIRDCQSVNGPGGCTFPACSSHRQGLEVQGSHCTCSQIRSTLVTGWAPSLSFPTRYWPFPSVSQSSARTAAAVSYRGEVQGWTRSWRPGTSKAWRSKFYSHLWHQLALRIAATVEREAGCWWGGLVCFHVAPRSSIGRSTSLCDGLREAFQEMEGRHYFLKPRLQNSHNSTATTFYWSKQVSRPTQTQGVGERLQVLMTALATFHCQGSHGM